MNIADVVVPRFISGGTRDRACDLGLMITAWAVSTGNTQTWRPAAPIGKCPSPNSSTLTSHILEAWLEALWTATATVGARVGSFDPLHSTSSVKCRLHHGRCSNQVSSGIGSHMQTAQKHL